MLNTKLKIFSLICINLFFSANANFDLNLYKRYDVNFKPYRYDDKPFLYAFLFEHALDIYARNNDGDRKNVLQLWNDDIDGLAMLRGFKKDSKIGELATALNLVNDVGTRGRVVPCGDLKAWGASSYLRYNLPHDVFISLFIPVYSMSLNRISFKDETQNLSFLDDLTKDDLTNEFRKNVQDLSGIYLGPWKRTGFGDLMGTIEWDRNFIQEKPILKEVHLNGRLGVNFPTGLKLDEDKLFEIPFGYQFWGLYFGGGIDLLWWNCIKGGIDVEFLQLFSAARCVRVKTDRTQTDLLLLAKTRAIVEPGFVSRYNLYLEAHKFNDIFNLRVAYQYYRKTKDRLWLFDNQYSNEIANTSDARRDSTLHQFLFIFGAEFDQECYNTNFSLFYKLPFEGKRSLQTSTIGLNFYINF
ncbi:MAG: hypothetical protein P4L22_06525 [Candidatus Babeliales bacterium]|nr:hypothetical protein [Candidatus Babeliales bacterium]